MNENDSLKKQIHQMEQENKQDRWLTEEWIKQHVNHLSIEHIKLGPIGYVNYLYDILKNRVICTDISRKKFKYLNDKGVWTTDPELLTLSSFIFQFLKNRHKELSSEYIQKLTQDLSESSDINTLSQRMETTRIFSDHERLLFKMLEGDRNQYYNEIIRHLCVKL